MVCLKLIEVSPGEVGLDAASALQMQETQAVSGEVARPGECWPTGLNPCFVTTEFVMECLKEESFIGM